MRIPCPACGSRDAADFVYRGDASPVRPPLGQDDAAAMDTYLHLRDNPAGALTEHWYHATGCRQWLVVTRDTRTHAIHAAVLAPGAGR